MSRNKDYKPPKAGTGDVVHAIARAGLGAIPYAGAAARELLNAIVTPPLERRRDKWMERVGEGLQKLEQEKGINLEELRKNDAFIDIAMQASQAALRTSKEEKLQALRNAILNSALPNPPDESLQQMFVNFVDTLTVWHLRLLDLVQSPPEWAKRHQQDLARFSMGGFSTIIESAFPELSGKREFYDQLGKDLLSRGLAHATSYHMTMTGTGLMQKGTTPMGDEFLDFISNPIED